MFPKFSFIFFFIAEEHCQSYSFKSFRKLSSSHLCRFIAVCRQWSTFCGFCQSCEPSRNFLWKLLVLFLILWLSLFIWNIISFNFYSSKRTLGPYSRFYSLVTRKCMFSESQICCQQFVEVGLPVLTQRLRAVSPALPPWWTLPSAWSRRFPGTTATSSFKLLSCSLHSIMSQRLLLIRIWSRHTFGQAFSFLHVGFQLHMKKTVFASPVVCLFRLLVIAPSCHKCAPACNLEPAPACNLL